MREVVAVGEACGVQFLPDVLDPRRGLLRGVPRDWTPSMAVDTRCRWRAVLTPAEKAASGQVRGMERRGGRSPRYRFTAAPLTQSASRPAGSTQPTGQVVTVYGGVAWGYAPYTVRCR
jgi:hypothetical protein